MFRQILDKLIANKKDYDEQSQQVIDYWDELASKAERFENLKKNDDYKILEEELKAEIEKLLKELLSIEGKTFNEVGQKYHKIMTELNARLNVIAKVDGTIKQAKNLVETLKNNY